MKGSQLQQDTAELLLEVAGYSALEFNPDFVSGYSTEAEGDLWALTIAPNHYWARHVSIVGGSNEIQRNILAKTVLGL
jgi:alkylation response protein AidB-like acyl-CoA dehydrogenase